MQLLTPRYNRHKSEAEIQADVYAHLILHGLDPKLEVVGYIPNEKYRNGKQKCLFDIVVFWPLNHKPICIIECKKGLGVRADSYQIHKYKMFGLPVLVCGRTGHDNTIRDAIILAWDDERNAPPSFNWGLMPPKHSRS